MDVYQRHNFRCTTVVVRENIENIGEKEIHIHTYLSECWFQRFQLVQPTVEDSW